jgi:U-box domain
LLQDTKTQKRIAQTGKETAKKRKKNVWMVKYSSPVDNDDDNDTKEGNYKADIWKIMEHLYFKYKYAIYSPDLEKWKKSMTFLRTLSRLLKINKYETKSRQYLCHEVYIRTNFEFSDKDLTETDIIFHNDFPDYLLDSITGELLRNPYTTDTGVTYNLQTLKQLKKDPLSRNPICLKKCIHNINIKKCVETICLDFGLDMGENAPP